MLFKSTLIATCGLAVSSLAQIADVTITASHGGAGNGLTNTTVIVPLGTPYTNSALDTVSYLYLTGANGAALEDITCQAYVYPNGTGAAGQPFTHISPALLSTNTVIVGSLQQQQQQRVQHLQHNSSRVQRDCGLANPFKLIVDHFVNFDFAQWSSHFYHIGQHQHHHARKLAQLSRERCDLNTSHYDDNECWPIRYLTNHVDHYQRCRRGACIRLFTNHDQRSRRIRSSLFDYFGSPRTQHGNAADSLPVTEGAWFALAIAALGLAMAV
ncbi:hypothetical protein LTR15_003425 [Elasticomyces elasticus]|nr:hypothetical protein LTR15_003425 [Elasticomyces elasticus]